ncbi:hypothetical protein DMUE_4084 [Dictyocoela muelleri]|nr:hypothetical protein DMUE_4084 [Dictyocoela muelleri]
MLQKSGNIAERQGYSFNKKNKNEKAINQIGKLKNNKYCSYHQTNSHSDEECRVRKKTYKSLESDNSDKKVMSVQEPIPATRSITIPIKCVEKNYTALLDTGSEYNYVSDKIINGLSSSEILKTKRKTVELANGLNAYTDSYIEEEIILFNDYNSKIKERFYILKDLH